VAGLTLALLVLHPSPAAAHESDQYTLPVGREFADLGPYFTRVVYDAIVEAVRDTNTAIERSLQGGRPTERTSKLQSPSVIAKNVWLELFAAFPTNESLDHTLATARMRSRYPGLITIYVPEQAIYDDPLLMLDLTKVIRTTFRAATVSADTKVFGTDKIIHFLHMGRAYHFNYLNAKKEGLAEEQSIARAFPDANNLFLSENWLLGMGTTGIRSNGDLAADYAGFKFYRNLTEQVRIGERVLAPMLVRDGPYWRLNQQVHPGSDFFTAFITPHWNEALNPNLFTVLTDARIRTLLRERCADVLDWYRDERGRPLSREQFAQLEEALATLYGESYGYQNDGKNNVSIATTCFPAAQPSGAERRSTVGSCMDWREQTPFGLQSGWARQVRVQCSSSARAASATIDRFGRTPLWWAAKEGSLERVQRLITAGENPNAADFDGEGPLHVAARWEHVAIVEVLIAHGSDPNARALYGVTPLHVAVLAGQVGAARALLAHGADVKARDLFGKSPLHDAVLRGDPELVALLLQYGADPEVPDDGGTTPLRLAKHAADKRLLKAFSPSGSDQVSGIDRR
jgi:ankyrin repeat protein